MSWNDTATTTTDWSAQSFAAEFWQAVGERYIALGLTGWTPILPAIGADLQDGRDQIAITEPYYHLVPNWPTSTTGSFAWARLQSFAVDNCGSFARAKTLSGSTWSPVTDFDGYSGTLPWTWADLAACALGQPHFTRKHRQTRIDLPDYGEIVTTTGIMQPGDYIGPWIFNELRAVLNELLWTYGNATNTPATDEEVYIAGSPNMYPVGSRIPWDNQMWLDATAAIVAMTRAADDTAMANWVTSWGGYRGPGAWYNGTYRVDAFPNFNPPPPFWPQVMMGLKTVRHKWRARFTKTGPVSRAVEFYLWPGGDTTHGDFAHVNAYNLVSTASDDGAIAVSEWMGSNAVPTPLATPSFSGYTHGGTPGQVVVKWNFTQRPA